MSKFKKSDFRPAGEWIESLPAESKARIEADTARIVEAAHLADIRKALSVTQAELAGRSGLKQGEVSRIEHRTTTVQLKTLEKYVEALGGEVRIVADFPDGTRAVIPLKSGRPVKTRTKVSSRHQRAAT